MESSPKPPAKTVAERMKAMRSRRKEAGIAELRGVLLPVEWHEDARRIVDAWAKRKRKAP